MTDRTRRIVFALLCCVLIPLQQAVAETATLPPTISGPNGHTLHLVPPAHFEMGSLPWETFLKGRTEANENDAQPLHPVVLARPFYLGRTEVTVGQYAAFMEATHHETVADFGVLGWQPSEQPRDMNRRDFVVDDAFSWRNPGYEQTEDHPVTCVSHADAVAYCRWLSEADPSANYRLPTEAEWEHAASGGDTSRQFSFGDDYRNQIARHANVADRSLEQAHPRRGLEQWLFDPVQGPDDGFACTAPVGSFQPNAFGLQDVHGNVWEWCQDQYLDTWYQRFPKRRHGEVRPRAIDPVCDQPWNGHGPWHVIRGGSFVNSPLQSRSAVRGVLHGRDATCYVGFRIVRDVAPEHAEAFVQRHQRSENAREAWTAIAKQVREYDDGVLRFECETDSVDDSLWERLSDLRYPVEITLRPPGSIPAERLRHFAAVSELRGLRLAIRIDGLTRDSLSWLVDARQLRSFQWTSHPDAGNDAVLEHLRNADRLESLMLSGTGIDDEGLRSLPADTPLTTLHVAGTGCRGETLHHFESKSLEEISIALSDEGAARAAEHASLKRINASEGTLTHNGIESLSKLRHLQRLTLRGCRGIDRLPPESIGRMSNLISLDVRGVAGDDSWIEAAVPLLNLRELSLSVAPQSTSAGEHNTGWRQIHQLIGLRSLTVEGTNPLIDAETFESWLNMPNLNRLVLDRDVLDIDELRREALMAEHAEVRVEIR